MCSRGVGLLDLDDATRSKTTTTTLTAVLVTLALVLRVHFRQTLAWHQVHHCRLAQRQLKNAQGDISVQESTLKDKSQYIGLLHLLVVPLLRPIIKDVLRNLRCRTAR